MNIMDCGAAEKNSITNKKSANHNIPFEQSFLTMKLSSSAIFFWCRQCPCCFYSTYSAL